MRDIVDGMIFFDTFGGWAAEWSDFRNWLRREGLLERDDDDYGADVETRYAQDCDGEAATGDLFAEAEP